MPLKDVQLRTAKSAAKPYKLKDGGGLHLLVTPAGGRLWRLRYEYGGKEKSLALGQYPDVSLAQAREARDAAKAELREGTDPSAAKRQRKAVAVQESVETFESMAREWHGLHVPRWAPVHAGDVLTSLKRDMFPTLGHVPVRQITAPMVLEAVRKIEKRGSGETARRVRQRMSAVFVYAIASGRAETDPAAIVAGAMAPVKRRRQPAITDLAKARGILQAVEAIPSYPVTKLALRFLALTAVRPGTLAATPWAEFNALDRMNPVWLIPAQRMKLRLDLKDDEARDHLVPLPREAIEIIEVMRGLTGKGPIVWPNSRWAHRPMSENAMGYLLNRAGYSGRHVPHGWRSTFSTIMNEAYKADRPIIDLMLAHVPENKVEGAYNRAAYLDRRTELAQLWADLIMVGRPPAAELLKGPRHG